MVYADRYASTSTTRSPVLAVIRVETARACWTIESHGVNDDLNQSEVCKSVCKLLLPSINQSHNYCKILMCPSGWASHFHVYFIVWTSSRNEMKKSSINWHRHRRLNSNMGLTASHFRSSTSHIENDISTWKFSSALQEWQFRFPSCMGFNKLKDN